MARNMLCDPGMTSQRACAPNSPLAGGRARGTRCGVGRRSGRESDADAPEAAGTPEAPEAPDATQAPPAPEAPEAPQAPDAPERPRAEVTQISWYGWQTMLADAGVIALWLAAYAVDEAKYGSSSAQSYDRGTNLLVASGVAVYFWWPGDPLGARPRPQGAGQPGAEGRAPARRAHRRSAAGDRRLWQQRQRVRPVPGRHRRTGFPGRRRRRPRSRRRGRRARARHGAHRFTASSRLRPVRGRRNVRARGPVLIPRCRDWLSLARHIALAGQRRTISGCGFYPARCCAWQRLVHADAGKDGIDSTARTGRRHS